MRGKTKQRYKKSTSTVNVERYPSPIAVRISAEPTRTGLDEMVIVPDVLSVELTDRLLSELHALPEEYWIRWHRRAHWILEEQRDWRAEVPSWLEVFHCVEATFRCSINASRLNRFSDPQDYKPFHHDASAIIPSRTRTQNTSIVVSIGEGRPVRFYHEPSKSTLDFSIPSRGAYAFGAGVNNRWMHGVGKGLEDDDRVRFSLAFWGWTD